MNPIKNKKNLEELVNEIRNFAYTYIEKYSPSKQQLKVYLLKKYLTKIKGTKSKKEVTAIIDEISAGQHLHDGAVDGDEQVCASGGDEGCDDAGGADGARREAGGGVAR